MAKRVVHKTNEGTAQFPILKTIEQMSKISGIGENRLRQLVEKGEIEYIQNGNRRLLTDEAIWDWYQRAKRPVACNK
ncbi:DNA-binding protein [Oscillibacter sp.]|uniref:DNA-binding protein n=1 Tax=Oscillibacter sp. TaxID=1945593 RepID=UPI0028980BFA|nr:DNA-binding protein [Oscillibacter sp.]